MHQLELVVEEVLVQVVVEEKRLPLLELEEVQMVQQELLEVANGLVMLVQQEKMEQAAVGLY